MLGFQPRPSVSSLCSQCLHRLTRNVQYAKRPIYRSALRSNYFTANKLSRPEKLNGLRFSSRDSRKSSTAATIGSQLPSSPSASAKRLKYVQPTPSPDEVIPPDASSQLTTLGTSLPKQSLRRKLAAYLSLTKPRLTFLMVLTTTAAYSLYPVPTILDPSTTTAPSLSTITLLFLTSGTFLTASSANAFNMALEPEHDAKMSRTRNRPLVRGLLTRRAALLFALATAVTGTAALYYGVNPTTATLAAGNIILYAGVYTPLKRIHPINTWVGAVVGAIPPLMGWAAAAGQVASEAGDWRELLLGPDAAGGWALAALLFAWQIPHFAGLSFSIRHEYAAAGYRMLASSRPRLDAVLSLVCALALPVATAELQAAQVVEPWAVTAAMPANVWMVWSSWQFLRLGGSQATARKLFWASVWYLPIVLVLAMVGKKGLGDRVYGWVTGASSEEEEEDEDEEDEEENDEEDDDAQRGRA